MALSQSGLVLAGALSGIGGALLAGAQPAAPAAPAPMSTQTIVIIVALVGVAIGGIFLLRK